MPENEHTNIVDNSSRNRSTTLRNLRFRKFGLEGPLASVRRRTLKTIVKENPSPFVLQIGANDGKFDDPLYPFLSRNPGVRGLLVEPLERPFQSLNHLYQDRDNIETVRTAITSTIGSVTLFKVELDSPTDPFGDALARTNPDLLDTIMDRHPKQKKHGYKITPEVVPTMTLDALFSQSEIEPEEVEIFFSDTEGSDIEVMTQLLDSSARPELIQYEQVLATDEDVSDLNRRLLGLDYALHWSYRDVLAVRNPKSS